MVKSWKRGLAIGVSAIMAFPAAALAADQPIHSEEVKVFQKAAKSASITAGEKERKLEAYKANKEMNRLADAQTLVIKYKKPIAKSIHKKAGVKLVRSLPQLGYDVVYIPKKAKASDVLKVYRKQKEVVSITPSIKYKQFAAVKGDPKKSKMYHLPMLNVDKALPQAGKHQVTVAVVDGGVDYKHPDLKGQLLPPYNAADPARTPVRDLHGTHVAGIIGAKADNGIGGHGVNPKAKILPVDVFNGDLAANDFTIAEGILYAISKKANVINLSLGGPASSPVVAEAIEKAIDAGIVVVAAAGNERTDTYSYPAAYPGVISVGNINRHKKLSDSSNYGASVDVVAPGEDIYNTGYEQGKGSTFSLLTGTSMASPMVAGAASLLKSKYPNLTSYDVENILERTATDLGPKGYDLTFANGLVNPLNALKFDPKKLPKKPVYTGDELIKSAKALTKEKNTLQGSIKSPGEMHWYKIPLNEKEHVQTVLSASQSYDYGMEFYFIPEGAEAEEGTLMEWDKGRAGKQEGYLYTAEEKGTLVIGIKDVNGSYDASGKSSYTFKADKYTDLKADQATQENPVNITSLPFIKEDFTVFSEEEGTPDYDYFTLSVDQPKVLSISLSDLPGVNTSISVSMSADGEEVVSADDNGLNDGEVLSFKAVPGVKYEVAVTNEVISEDMSMDSILSLLGMGEDAMELSSYDSSAYPYQLKVEEKQLPEDEDGLPFTEDLEASLQEGDIDPQEYADEKAAEKIDHTLEEESAEEELEEEDMTKDILAHALPYTLGNDKQGYFQVEGDEDYYKFTPSADGIYDIQVKKGSSMTPTASILEYDKESESLIPIIEEADTISAILGELLGMQQNATNAALNAGKTYILKLENSSYDLSADPYTIQTAKVADLPKEIDEDENNPEQALSIKQGKSYHNFFIRPGDTDHYYFKNGAGTDIYRLMIRSPKPTAEQAKVPYNLRTPIVFSGQLIEDTNGDKVLDEEEKLKAVPFGPNLMEMSFDTKVDLSFKAKKNAGYFLMVSPFTSMSPNVQPYEVKLAKMFGNVKDGDGKVVQHVPAKPISLKKMRGGLGINGYMNAEVPFGDVDHFVLNVAKDKQYAMNLQMEQGLDGKIEIYNAKGKLVQSFDQYGSGDEELAVLHLKKGRYFIEISETQGRASAQPYQLTIK
ncbi:S8 family peptidase [Bacillus xiapuensis]|uniref:S8 family peptidase n=1 Tax=Bacillus xiapuensis TaxID=2014075 RepID=UPI0012FD8762|nr:S8 family serine peptidase [Bacillus xiapuensis]